MLDRIAHAAGPGHGGRCQHVRLEGVLTASSASRLLDALRTASPPPGRVEIDLSGVTRVDRGGAATLVDAYVATVLRNRQFAIRSPSAICEQTLRRFGVFDIVEIVTGRAAARRTS